MNANTKYEVIYEDEKAAFYMPLSLPFAPVVGDIIENDGIRVVVLKRTFRFSKGDVQWIGTLTVKSV